MCDEDAAKAALRALGIVPNRALVRSWIQASRADEHLAAREREKPSSQAKQSRLPPLPEIPSPIQEVFPRWHPRGYSKSRLEPMLRREGALLRQPGPRQPGRPRIIAKWFPAVAQSMADGNTLRESLRLNGITLDKGQIRALYRNEEFKRLYWEARRASSGSKSPTTK